MINLEAVTDPRKYLGKPLQTWVTEYGFPTCSLETKPAQYQCIAPDVQAAYHVRGLIPGWRAVLYCGRLTKGSERSLP